MMTNKLNELYEEHKYAARSFKEKQQELFETEDDLDMKVQALERIQQLAQSVQKEAHKKICGLVTKCLQSVFGPKYDFEIEFVQRRNKTEAEMKLVKNGIYEFHPLEGSGGVKDVVSFACRLVAICLAKPKRRKVIILDEPFKWVSKKHRTTIKSLLETLAAELDMQIVMTTQIDDLRTGNIIEIT